MSPKVRTIRKIGLPMDKSGRLLDANGDFVEVTMGPNMIHGNDFHSPAFAAQTHNHDAAYAPIAKGVTNGDSHDHAGGDGAQIDHGGLAGLGDDDHTQYYNQSRGDARYNQRSNNLSDVGSPATAFGNIKQAASTSATGVVELATNSEAIEGSSSQLVVAPAGLKAAMDLRHRPYFFANKNTDQINVPDLTWVVVTFGNEVNDSDSCYDNTNHKFTPNKAGWYQFNWTISVYGGTNLSYHQCGLLKNGSLYVASNLHYLWPTAHGGYAGGAMAYANGSTDYFQMAWYYTDPAEDGLIYNGSLMTWWQGYYIGPQ